MPRSSKSPTPIAMPEHGTVVTDARLARMEGRALRRVPVGAQIFTTHLQAVLSVYHQLAPAEQAEFGQLKFIKAWVVHDKASTRRLEPVYIGFTERRAIRAIRNTLAMGADYGYIEQASCKTAYVSAAAVLAPLPPLTPVP